MNIESGHQWTKRFCNNDDDDWSKKNNIVLKAVESGPLELSGIWLAPEVPPGMEG